MANSLEVRSPFLDTDLVDYSFNIPSEKKIGFFKGKKILRHAYKNSIPNWYFKLPKKGFEVPLYSWLKKDLKYLVEKSCQPIVLDSLNIKNKDIVYKWKQELYAGKKDNSWKIWTLISYFHWAKEAKIL